MELLINPEKFEAEYNDYVGRVFPQWGGPPMYDWCFQRTVESKSADILLLEESGSPIAGTGVTYRQVLVGGMQLHAGILTGSWTTPEARGRGCFSRLIEEARRRSWERGAELLLAFVRTTNPSYRRLSAGGALCIPGYYLKFTPPESPDAGAVAEAGAVAVDAIDSVIAPELHLAKYSELFRKESESTNSIRFGYSFDSFVSQFWKRPKSVEVERIDTLGAIAIVSDYENLTVIHYLSERSGDARTIESVQALVSRAIALRRTLVMYSTSKDFAEVCLLAGFECDAGFVTVNHSSKDWVNPSVSSLATQLTEIPWDLQDGDKM